VVSLTPRGVCRRLALFSAGYRGGFGNSVTHFGLSSYHVWIKPVKKEVKTVFRQLRGLLPFVGEFLVFRRLLRATGRRTKAYWRDLYPCLLDKTKETGFDRHYVYHTAWAARVLAETRPARHVDISSSLYFVSLVSAFIPIEFFDFRPAALHLRDLGVSTGDLMNLPFRDRSVASISCMHVVEHVGLGRYGEPLDPDGDLKAMHELQRVVAPGGALLLVVPVGRPRIQFNAHRVYAIGDICSALSELTLWQFALVPEHPKNGGLIIDAAPQLVERETYGCGCFWFTRKPELGHGLRGPKDA
jgi:SAM-dependent methyltransferase